MISKQELFNKYHYYRAEFELEKFDPLNHSYFAKNKIVDKALTVLLQREVHYDKYFISNFLMQKNFYWSQVGKPKSFEIYYQFERFLIENYNKYYDEIYKTMDKYKELRLDFNHEENILAILTEDNYKFFGLFYQDVKHVLAHLHNQNTLKIITKFYFILKYMPHNQKVKDAAYGLNIIKY
jgi:hypothetical protein